jgi:lysine biosynthesis protein LysW
VGTCPECETNIDLDEEAAVGDIVVCPECKTRLEILDLNPVTLDYAIEDEETV